MTRMENPAPWKDGIPCSYMVYPEGSQIIARHGAYGGVVDQGDDFSTVMDTCIGELGTHGGKIYLAGTVQWDVEDIIDIDGKYVVVEGQRSVRLRVNNNNGVFRVKGSGLGVFKGFRMDAVAGKTGVGILVESGGFRAFDLYAYQLEGYMVKVDTVTAAVNYNIMEGLECYGCPGLLYAVGPAAKRSISLVASDLLARQCTEDAIKLENIGDVSLSNVIGETKAATTGDFLNLIKCSSINLENMNGTSVGGYGYEIDADCERILGSNLYTYASNRGMLIDGDNIHLVNVFCNAAKKDGVVIGGTLVYLTDLGIKDSSQDGSGAGYYDLKVTDGTKKHFILNVDIASTNPDAAISVPAVNKLQIRNGNVYNANADYDNAPSVWGDIL